MDDWREKLLMSVEDQDLKSKLLTLDQGHGPWGLSTDRGLSRDRLLKDQFSVFRLSIYVFLVYLGLEFRLSI